MGVVHCWWLLNKYLCRATSSRCLRLHRRAGAREEDGTCQTPCFQRSPPTSSKINMNRFVSCFILVLCKLTFLCCLSVQATVSLRVATWLPLALLACPMLSQLTSKAPVVLQTRGIQPFWFLKTNAMVIRLPCVNSLV